MDPAISTHFTESVINKVAGLYGLKRKQLSPLGGFDSLVFAFERPEGRFVLRVMQDPRRSESLVRGELDWVQHLIRNDVPAMRPIPSDMGNLIEIVPDNHGGNFLCVAFERAQGGEIRKAHLGESLFQNYGLLIGSMHSATKRYIPQDPTWRRPAWDSNGAISAEREMPLGQEEVMEKYRNLKDRLSRLPIEQESYGLIHTDVHFGNLSITEDFRLSVFDFAECCYGYFIYDIAMVFFYAVSASDNPDKFMGRFMPIFLEAYRDRNRIDPSWLAELPNFMTLREIDLYAEFLSYRAAGGDIDGNEWRDEFLDGRKERILSGKPYFDFDWPILAKYL